MQWDFSGRGAGSHPGPVWLRMPRLLESGHSEHLGDSLTGLQDGSSPLNCFVYLT